VNGADPVGRASRGYDAGKKINGRKHHIVTDTLGLLIVVVVTSAALQNRYGGWLVLARARMKMPSIVLVWADGGYAGKFLAFAQHYLRIIVEIVKRTDQRPTFEVLPRRWVIERTNSWPMRTRGLAREYERLAPPPGRRPWQPERAT